MPELPEVQTIVTDLQRRLVGLTISRVCLEGPQILRTPAPELENSLRHRRIRSVDRAGKRILIRLDGRGLLVIHLGMSGRITVHESDTPLADHTHLRLGFEGTWCELRLRDPRRFGGVWFFDRVVGDPPGLSSLGPDALTIRTSALRQICRRRRQIKALLLDQRIIAGMGNIYCDESLFAAGIHPLKPASDLDDTQTRRLATNLRSILRRAIRLGGSSLRDYRKTDGDMGMFQIAHRVYGREDEPCPRCGATIERIQVAGRSSHICPACQPRDSV